MSKKYSWEVSKADTIVAVTGAFIILALVIFGLPVLAMLLWNSVVVSVFAAPILSYWEAFGLYWLIKFTFGKINIDLGD